MDKHLSGFPDGADPAHHLDLRLLLSKSSWEVTDEATIIPDNDNNIISKNKLSKICRSTNVGGACLALMEVFALRAFSLLSN